MNIKTFINTHGINLSFWILFPLIAVFVLTAFAEGATFSREYQSEDEFVPGMLVSREESRVSYINRADTGNVSRLLGVVINDNGALFSVSSTEADVMVATEGTELAFVSTVNGDISPGDFITASPLRGVGMKTQRTTRVIGIAQEAFSGDTEGAEQISVAEEGGGEVTTYVGKIPVEIEVRNVTFGGERSEAVRFLQETTETFVGRSVSSVRALSAVFIVLATFTIAVLVFTNAARGSIVSVGRNPFAKKTIMSALFRFILVGGLIIIGGLGLAYAVLVL